MKEKWNLGSQNKNILSIYCILVYDDFQIEKMKFQFILVEKVFVIDENLETYNFLMFTKVF